MLVGLFDPLDLVANIFGFLNYAGLQIWIVVTAVEVVEALLFKFVDFVPPGEEDWFVSVLAGLIVLRSDPLEACIGHSTQTVDEPLAV